MGGLIGSNQHSKRLSAVVLEGQFGGQFQKRRQTVVLKGVVAGFEPTVRLSVQRFSRPLTIGLFGPVKPDFLSAKQKNTGLWEENYPAGPGKKTTAIRIGLF
jgi:hypothetical protein